MTTSRATHPSLTASDGDVVGLIGGSGVLFIQLCALIPGVLPLLLLAAVLALPLVLPVLVLGILVGVPVALWRLARRLLVSGRNRLRRGQPVAAHRVG